MIMTSCVGVCVCDDGLPNATKPHACHARLEEDPNPHAAGVGRIGEGVCASVGDVVEADRTQTQQKPHPLPRARSQHSHTAGLMHPTDGRRHTMGQMPWGCAAAPLWGEFKPGSFWWARAPGD